MLDWLKNINKVYPDFYKNYLSSFNKKSNRFVVISTEKTGTNTEKDVLLTIGAFAVFDDSIHVGDSFEAVLLQYRFFHDNKIPFDFIVESKLTKMAEKDAVTKFIDYIGNSVLVGHNIDIDVAMINAALERLECGNLKNEALDINIMYKKLIDESDIDYSLDELSKIYKIPLYESPTSHENAYRIALLFLKLKSKLGIK